MALVMWGIRGKIELESRAVGGAFVGLFKESITVTQLFQLNTKLTVNKWHQIWPDLRLCSRGSFCLLQDNCGSSGVVPLLCPPFLLFLSERPQFAWLHILLICFS